MTVINALFFGLTAVLIALNLVLLAATVYWAVHGLSEKTREHRLVRMPSFARHRRLAARS